MQRAYLREVAKWCYHALEAALGVDLTPEERAALMEAQAKVEIEATAVLPDEGT